MVEPGQVDGHRVVVSQGVLGVQQMRERGALIDEGRELGPHRARAHARSGGHEVAAQAYRLGHPPLSAAADRCLAVFLAFSRSSTKGCATSAISHTIFAKSS